MFIRKGPGLTDKVLTTFLLACHQLIIQRDSSCFSRVGVITGILKETYSHFYSLYYESGIRLCIKCTHRTML